MRVVITQIVSRHGDAGPVVPDLNVTRITQRVDEPARPVVVMSDLPVFCGERFPTPGTRASSFESLPLLVRQRQHVAI